jgi:hypothetical protein
MGMMQTVGDRSIMFFDVVSIEKNTKNLHLSIMGAPYEIIQTYLKSYSLGLQLSFFDHVDIVYYFQGLEQYFAMPH